jgi:hypothetical protein
MLLKRPLRPRSGGRGRGPHAAREVRWARCLQRNDLVLLQRHLTYPIASQWGPLLSPAARRRGRLIRRCVVRGGLGIFRIAPPITIEADEIDLGLEIFDRALARAVH